jgi:hypothetical protein
MNLSAGGAVGRGEGLRPGPLLVPAVLTLFKKAFWDQRRDM